MVTTLQREAHATRAQVRWCAWQARGIPKALSQFGSHLPGPVLARFGRAMPASSFSTALQMPHLIGLRQGATREAFALADRVIAVCDWVKRTLITNGVPESKMVLCRQGLPHPVVSQSDPLDNAKSLPACFSEDRPLSLAFFGRLDITKGLHVICRALQKLPLAPMRLNAYGLSQTQRDSSYETMIRRVIARDPRIQLLPATASHEVVERMAQHDLTVVPSTWLETGPLVVYESFAAGVPVLGSDRGGIAELVSDGVNGRLVKAGCERSWAGILNDLLDRPSLISRWRSGIPPIRSMGDVALSMRDHYASLVRDQGLSTLSPRPIRPNA